MKARINYIVSLVSSLLVHKVHKKVSKCTNYFPGDVIGEKQLTKKEKYCNVILEKVYILEET